jgi:hypothetical protein
VSELMPRDNTCDADVFARLCEEHLSVKPYVNGNNCLRIGSLACLFRRN